MKRLLFVLVLLFISGCATQAKFEARLKTWLGSSEQELVDRRGPPDQVYELGGKKYLTYIYSNSSHVPQTVHNTVVGNNIQTNVYGGYQTNWYCKTTYIFEKDIMVDYSFNGNACKS